MKKKNEKRSIEFFRFFFFFLFFRARTQPSENESIQFNVPLPHRENAPHQARHPGPDSDVPPRRLVKRDALKRHAMIVAAVAAARKPSLLLLVLSPAPCRGGEGRVRPQARRGCPGDGGEHGEGWKKKKWKKIRRKNDVAFFFSLVRPLSAKSKK